MILLEHLLGVLYVELGADLGPLRRLGAECHGHVAAAAILSGHRILPLYATADVRHEALG